jgi:hypothetical protein
MSKNRKRPTGETIGGILVGFDQQVFRNVPPPHELVQKSRPVRGLSGQGDGLEVTFPDDAETNVGDESAAQRIDEIEKGS